MKVVWLEAIKSHWRIVRPAENPEQIETLCHRGGDAMVVLMHMCFESGRAWQAKHPTADTSFPDYDAPEV